MDSNFNSMKSGNRQSAEEMDEARQRNIAYEYLCHLEEAKKWMEAVLKQPLPPTTELEENLRNGVYLAKLGNFVAPDVVPLSKIYDIFQHRYKALGLQFLHTENINYWIKSLQAAGFPRTFHPETTDVYDKKNMPKVVYCIHALSTHLFKLGQAPLMEDLYGKAQFTRQEIDSVCVELKRYGVTMPAFQKIGGLLAGELDCDSASVHAAIISINDAIDEKLSEKLLESLTLPSSSLSHVMPENVSRYMDTFIIAKEEKCRASQNKSLSESYEPDIYDELLTQGEIQGHIRNTNIECLWEDIMEAVKKKDREKLERIIMSPALELKEFIPDNIEFYVARFLELNSSQLQRRRPREVIKDVIRNANRSSKDQDRVKEALNEITRALGRADSSYLLRVLRTPILRLSDQVSDFAVPLYLEEMEADFASCGNLTYEDVKSSITVLNGIASVTSAVDSRDCDATWSALSNPLIPFMNLEAELKTKYLIALSGCRQVKLGQDVQNKLLTFMDIQECIDLANQHEIQQIRALDHLEDINESVRGGDLDGLLSSLQGLIPGEVADDEVPLCMNLLRKCLSRKQRNTGEGLWLEDVLSVVQDLHKYSSEARKICQWLCEVNTAISNNEERVLLRAIEHYNLEKPVDAICLVNNLKELQKKKSIKSRSCWLVHHLSPDVSVHLNLMTNTFSWTKPVEANGSSYFLSLDDIKAVITKLNGILSKTPNEVTSGLKSAEDYLIQLQAAIRGFLVRRRIRRLIGAVVTIQAWWRGVRQRRIYLLRKSMVQPMAHVNRLSRYENYVDQIVKIQACWRGYKTRKALRSASITDSVKPTFSWLRRLASLQAAHCYDYSTDLTLQGMKSSVVEMINRNNELARKLDEMDTKIGLLVQNRISVEALVAYGKQLQTVHGGGANGDCKGIKAFSKEAKTLLDGYQQLFYLLQTDPEYLTRLIVWLPSRSTHVISSCVLSLFNYGSSSRDAYLLLRLFRSALFQEVQCKFQTPVDAVTGNPLVLRLAVSFARQAEGQNPLRNILGFLIEKVLNDKTCIDTNPVDIYRRWVNQTETESGKCSELPYSVTQEQALAHPEVVRRLHHNIKILKSWVRCFLERLSQCINQFPYALRYIARLLKDALLQRFPDAAEKDILKIVGNLVYYQYINSAIVAPDAFYIISLPPDQHLKVEQRRNLASIAKILQFAASKKGFGEESQHLMCLNPFIIDCHEEMKRFCRRCCAIEDLEDHFNVTKYTEAALIEKPRIYITLEEICECHKLLLEARQHVAPDPQDPIHEILDDLGGPPSIATLRGCTPIEAAASRAGKMQVCLELDNRFQCPSEDITSGEKLFIKTKEMITGRIHELSGETLTSAVAVPEHSDIAVNLNRLELEGLVSSRNDYHKIVKSLIEDMTQREQYRLAQYKEMQVLRSALQTLDEKKKFYEDKLGFYEEYLKTCLSNLTAPRKSQKKERTVKYSGTRLREKGVLVALEGVPPGQLKNVQFDISSTDLNGIYSVRGRFMGVEVEKIDIDIQDLLKMQFEGHAVMDLFGKAKINVNLLLYLLNKKFHART